MEEILGLEGHLATLTSSRYCADDPRGWTVSFNLVGDSDGISLGQQSQLTVSLRLVSPGKETPENLSYKALLFLYLSSGAILGSSHSSRGS